MTAVDLQLSGRVTDDNSCTQELRTATSGVFHQQKPMKNAAGGRCEVELERLTWHFLILRHTVHFPWTEIFANLMSHVWIVRRSFFLWSVSSV